MNRRFCGWLVLAILLLDAPSSLIGTHSLTPFASMVCSAQQPVVVPRRQLEPPGPPKSPEEARAAMTVPAGFRVELVASEPDLLNPVAMAFDDRGRIYVTESFEYPRREAGPGRDRIKILEDTDRDGKIDKVTVFAEGLNIPSGIAVGHGGVWVANAPDLLFLQDTDGDDRADRQTVILTGFGRDDTHELPNALTWGPDGWLYGLNGVFNRSRIEHQGQSWDFTCALFRIHPKSHRFELFAEGTSNPWGVAFDQEGSAFVSACVIDHLWHLSETGYYERQGGPYPPHTWKMDSIVDYTHQMAAYCGIEYFDSEAYPAEYRHKLYMGNIHGGCINVDRLERHGASYRGRKEPDFLTAHDVWFMPVAQKIGPDGCLYVLDWYDRYHCYQDASADPAGVDRGHGRLYRIVYDQRPSSSFASLDETNVLQALHYPNAFWRQRALVWIAEHATPALVQSLDAQVRDTQSNESSRRQALWALLGCQGLPEATLQALLSSDSPSLQAWAIRAAAHLAKTQSLSPASLQAIGERIHSPEAKVRVEIAIAARALRQDEALDWLLPIASQTPADPTITRLVWKNLLPYLVPQHQTILRHLGTNDLGTNDLGKQGTPDKAGPANKGLSNTGSAHAAIHEILPRLAERWLVEPPSPASQASSMEPIERVVDLLRWAQLKDSPSLPALRQLLIERWQQGSLQGTVDTPWVKRLLAIPAPQADTDSATKPPGNNGLPSQDQVFRLQVQALAGDRSSLPLLAGLLRKPEVQDAERLTLCKILLKAQPSLRQELFTAMLLQEGSTKPFPASVRDYLLNAIAGDGNPTAIPEQEALLDAFPRFPVGLQASLANRFTQRDEIALRLLARMDQGKLPKDLLGPNPIKQLAKGSPETQRLVRKLWGEVRQETPVERQKIVAHWTDYLMWDASGDPKRGWAVYDRVCGQCHRLDGRGNEVGPDITRNGRASFEQLLSSVFDPSLVIGDAYRAVIISTDDGRIIQGIVTEQNDQQVVVKVQGGKTESIPRDAIERMTESDKSLMPEGLESQINQQELADLFALLALENPTNPGDSERIRGTPANLLPSK